MTDEPDTQTKQVLRALSSVTQGHELRLRKMDKRLTDLEEDPDRENTDQAPPERSRERRHPRTRLRPRFTAGHHQLAATSAGGTGISLAPPVPATDALRQWGNWWRERHQWDTVLQADWHTEAALVDEMDALHRAWITAYRGGDPSFERANFHDTAARTAARLAEWKQQHQQRHGTKPPATTTWKAPPV